MGLLLDTHTFLWCLLGDAKLSPQTRQRVTSPASAVLLSVVSIWEISIKISRGNLNLPESLTSNWSAAIEASQFRPLSISFDHALAVRALPFHHRDPFDRMLVAQAQVEGLTIVTADPMFARYDVPIIDATK